MVVIAVEGVKKFGYTSMESPEIGFISSFIIVLLAEWANGIVEIVVDVASVVDSVTELVAWIADNAVVGVVTENSDSKSIKAHCEKSKRRIMLS